MATKMKLSDLTANTPVKDLRTFIKQEGLDVSGQVGGRSKRTGKDVYADILEALQEKEQMELLRKPLFPAPTKQESLPLEFEEDVSDSDSEEEMVIQIERPSSKRDERATTKPSVTTEKAPATSKSAEPAKPTTPLKKLVSGEEGWSQWLLVKTEGDDKSLYSKLPTTPAVYELGIALQDNDPKQKNSRDRLRITNIKFLGTTSNLQQSVKNHCSSSKDTLYQRLEDLVKTGYDVFVHILPVTSRGAADKVATNILFQWVYEWNATNQERSKDRSVLGKVYCPQTVEMDQDVIDMLNKLKF